MVLRRDEPVRTLADNGRHVTRSEEPVEPVRAVLHPPEPVHQRDELVDAGDGVVGDAAFEVGPHRLTALSPVGITVSQSACASRNFRIR